MNTLSDTEWAVLEVLWGKNFFILGEVVDALKPATGWSRNTVHTYLTRMERKGLVTIDKEHYPHRYRAALSREEGRTEERRSFLSRVYQGSAGDLVAAFLKEEPISPQERERLKKLLDEMEV